MSNHNPYDDTNPQPMAGQGYDPNKPYNNHMHYTTPPPPKQKTSAFKVMLGVVGAFFVIVFLGFAGCAALIGGATDDAEDNPVVSSTPFTHPPTPGTSKPSPKVAKDNPPQKLVKGAQVGPFVLTASVKISKDGLDSFSSNVNARNNSDEEQMALFKITLLKGDDIIGTLDCIGGGGKPTAPGRTTTARCISNDDYVKGWTRIELEHTGF